MKRDTAVLSLVLACGCGAWRGGQGCRPSHACPGRQHNVATTL